MKRPPGLWARGQGWGSFLTDLLSRAHVGWEHFLLQPSLHLLADQRDQKAGSATRHAGRGQANSLPGFKGLRCQPRSPPLQCPPLPRLLPCWRSGSREANGG